MVSSNFTFTTKSRTVTTPPSDVTGFTATPSSGRVSLSWTNPTDADFKGVMLRYRTDGTYPTSKTDGVLAADRTGVPGATDYFDHLSLLPTESPTIYSAFSYDTTLNYSSTAHTQATPISLSIASLSPNRGSVADRVVISGTGFGAPQGGSKVTFNGIVAQISNWSATSITATVPPNSPSGFVIVTVNGAQTNGVTFKIGEVSRVLRVCHELPVDWSPSLYRGSQ